MMNRRALTHTRRYLFLVFLLSFGLISAISHAQEPPPAPQHDPQAQVHRDKATSLMDQSDWNGALTEFQAAYAIDKNSSPEDSATDLLTIGICYSSLTQYDKAIPYFQQTLPIFQQFKDIAGQALVLDNLGNAYRHLAQPDKAIEVLQQALTLFQQLNNQDGQEDALNNLGISYAMLNQYDKAMSFYQQALTLDRQAKDLSGQADALNNIGSAYVQLNQFQKAITLYQEALTLYIHTKEYDKLASTLKDLGNAYTSLDEYAKAIGYYQQALAFFQKLKDTSKQADTLIKLGNGYFQLSQNAKAINCYQQALPLFQQVKDIDGQAKVLDDLGNAYTSLSQYDKAIHSHQEAITLFKQSQDISGQAYALNDLGNAYRSLAQYDTAIGFYQQALPLHQQLKDAEGQAQVLDNLGNVYTFLDQYDTSLSFYQQALPLYRQAKDIAGQAKVLNDQGIIYRSISQDAKAIGFFEQALPLFQQVKDQTAEAGALLNLGNADYDLSQDAKAISNFRQALVIFQKLKDTLGQASALNNLASAQQDLGQYHESINTLQQALPLFQQTHNSDGQANVFTNLGSAYASLKQDAKATQLFQKAVPLFQQVRDPEGEAISLGDLMRILSRRALPRTAIFYGKQAVNAYQSIRQNIQAMDKQIQNTYLKDKEPTYRELAELLIKQGRLPEAEQVLGLLKDQELTGFVQRDPTAVPSAQRTLPYDPAEQSQKDSYATLSDEVTALGTQIDAIRRKKPLSLADAKQLTQLQDQLQPAQAKFQTFLTDLPKELPEPKTGGSTPGQLLLDKSLQGPFQKTLFNLGPGTVALYTIVEADKYRVVVLTSQTQIAREYPIKSDDLRAKIAAFREVLQDPTRDPRPLAHDLYTILIGPIEKDLDGAQATTLMWSLDDVLRYIPMAALYDGKQYLVERYRCTEFTGASLSGLDATPPAQYSVLGLGVSEAHPGYPPLPGVPQELNGIVKEGVGSPGVMDGTILLDGQLTWDALKTDLNLGYPAVHIASHFALGADYAHSFLLLGDGPHSLDELSTQSQIFQSAALLTLSACETGVGNTDGDGREIESFGSLAQEKGAQSIIASLWPVADASTPLLMDGFYKQLSLGNVSKGEALRQAQLSLLNGTSTASASGTQRAEIVPDKKNKPIATAPPFTPDSKAPFAHPYYWAPFILIGNWK